MPRELVQRRDNESYQVRYGAVCTSQLRRLDARAGHRRMSIVATLRLECPDAVPRVWMKSERLQ